MDLTRIVREAFESVKIYTEVLDACPYPFDSPEGRAFVKAFATFQESAATREAAALIEKVRK